MGGGRTGICEAEGAWEVLVVGRGVIVVEEPVNVLLCSMCDETLFSE